MRLNRLEVRNFRKLSKVVIDGLQPGLNIIVGDNEAGKSTLLAALRAALFERHRVGGQALAAMLPYRQSVRPEIELDFEVGGDIHRLRKVFGPRPEADLDGRGRRWSGDAADQQLSELLGFAPPGAGKSKPEEHHGAFSLLWVEQGGAFRSLGIGEGKNRVAAALESEIGEIVGGDKGRQLLGLAEARRSDYWDKRGNPRGELKQLEATLREKGAEAEQTRAQLRELEERVDQLDRITRALDEYTHEQTLERAKEKLAVAEAGALRIGEVENEAKAAAAELERAQLQHQAASDRLQVRQDMIRRLADVTEGMASVQREVSDAASVLARRDAVEQVARRVAGEAAEALLLAGGRLRQLEAGHAARQLHESFARLETQAREAEAAEAERLSAVAELGVLPPQTDLLKIEQLEATRDRLQHRMDDASVKLTLVPDAGAGISVDGVARGAGELSLSRDSVLLIPGYGRIEIRPGGGVEALSAELAAAEEELRQALAALHLSDVAGSRAAAHRRKAAEEKLSRSARTLASLAPEGMGKLREMLASQRAQLGTVGPMPAEPEPGEIERVRHQHADAEQRSAELARQLSEAAAETQASRTLAAVLNERLAGWHTDQARATDALTGARNEAGDDLLTRALETSVAAFQQATSNSEARMSALRAADPDGARQAVARAQQAVAGIEADIRKLTESRRELEAELRALGRDGLSEHLADLEGQVEGLGRTLEARRLEARAARLLHDTLVDVQRETKGRWLAPIRNRVEPYLRLLAPGATVELDEDTLELSVLERDGEAEPFNGLSIGAREQIAVVTRLAIADVLRQSGQPACIVLDDALVNSDETRLELMRQVLGKAAENLQILILSCHERDYRPLGAPIWRI